MCKYVILAGIVILLVGCAEDIPEPVSAEALLAILEELEQSEILGNDGAPMVLISAGDFQMGTEPSEVEELVQWANKWLSEPEAGWDFGRETPRHTVYVDTFHIDKYEVTNALYKIFMDATGHNAPRYWDADRYNALEQPVVGVSWYDAKAYAGWASKRLPTEAEWEKAARGGLVAKRFSWGDSDPDGSQCNFADKSADFNYSAKSVDDGYQFIAPVGSFTPNAYGLYDMAGNVWEWCEDWYDEKYYAISPKYNPTGPSSGTSRVLRGGSWDYVIYHLRAACRGGNAPADKSIYAGFRCVQDVTP